MVAVAKSRQETEKKENSAILDSLSLSILAVSIILILAPSLPWPLLALIAILPLIALAKAGLLIGQRSRIRRERAKESALRNGGIVLGQPPMRQAIQEQIKRDKQDGNLTISKYLIGFELDTGAPIWIGEDDLCTHAAVFAKTGVGKTLWILSLLAQQMARGRASGATFIDAKRDSDTLAQIILMALTTGRIEDLIIIDPFDPIHSYNFVLTNQKADVKSRKVLRAGLPPIGEASPAKHYDRLASDAVARIVRGLEATGLGYTLQDISATLNSFSLAYTRITGLLKQRGELDALTELSHLFNSYTDHAGEFHIQKVGDNLRGIASELQSISGSELGRSINTAHTDLNLTDAMLRGKIVYYMLPRLEEAEAAARMVKIFREDLEISIGQIISTPSYRLEDPHLVMVDEAGSTLAPSWASLFELARKGRFAFIIGAQSIGSLTDKAQGLSKEFMERVLANINLKIVMRVGDDQTADTLSKWMGMTERVKKSVGRTRTLLNPAERMKSFANVSVTEEEAEAVSADDLKHGLSAEKGLAYFDIGDGTIRQGRTLWVNASPPASWNSRGEVIRKNNVYADTLDLAGWINRQVLEKTGNDVPRKPTPAPPIPPPLPPTPAANSASVAAAAAENDAVAVGSGRIISSGQSGLKHPPPCPEFLSPKKKGSQRKKALTASSKKKVLPRQQKNGFQTSEKIEKRLLEKGRTSITKVTFNEKDFLDEN